MKHLLASLFLITSVSIVQANDLTVSLDDILLLSQRNVSDETILVLLQNRKITFTPDADDIDRLLEAGLGEDVIRYLIQNTASAPPTDAPRYAYTPVTVTYVDPYPAYYYRPYYTGTSLYFGYSAFPHTSYRYRPHRSAPSHLAYKTHGSRVTHKSGYNPGHATTSVPHSTSSAGHGKTSSINHGGSSSRIGHNKTSSINHGGSSSSIGHSKTNSINHGGSSSSIGHSKTNSINHGGSSNSIGHSRSNSVGHRKGHSSRSGGHRSGRH